MGAEKEKAVVSGYDFDLVKQGPDQDQVTSVITSLNNLIESLKKENEQLKSREDHLLSLARLAEKVIIEADIVAADIKKLLQSLPYIDDIECSSDQEKELPTYLVRTKSTDIAGFQYS
ncbi:MAG: hypothetical protein PHH02_02415 [Dehalococcoidales bacterium]|nr:hypothetical protein [Dehalococcoidales bacterium]